MEKTYQDQNALMTSQVNAFQAPIEAPTQAINPMAPEALMPQQPMMPTVLPSNQLGKRRPVFSPSQEANGIAMYGSVESRNKSCKR